MVCKGCLQGEKIKERAMRENGIATAVVLSYKRPRNVEKIVDRILLEPTIAEVIIWDNSGTEELVAYADQHEDVRLVRSKTNEFTLARFRAASMAKTDIIYTQDDDVMVGNLRRVIQGCIDTGKITAYMDRGHIEYGKTKWIHEAGIETLYESMLGYGSAFKLAWTAVLDEWIDRFGEDELLVRKADRIFCMLASRNLGEHNIIETVPDEFPDSRDAAMALHRREDHWRMSAEAAERCVELVSGRPATNPVPAEEADAEGTGRSDDL